MALTSGESMDTAPEQDTLIFVYNADSGLLNMIKDGFHKVVSPSTYPCRLCDLTWSIIGERKRWRVFVDNLPAVMEFLHRDEFEQRYPGVPLRPPNACRIADDRPIEVIGRDAMQSFSSLAELQVAVRAIAP